MGVEVGRVAHAVCLLLELAGQSCRTCWLLLPSLTSHLHCSAAADIADGEPTAETLAIRFGNSESASHLTIYLLAVSGGFCPHRDDLADLPSVCTTCFSDAQLFKTAFESAQAANASLVSGTDAPSASAIPQDPEATSAKESEPAIPKAEEAAATSSAS